jgi:hypothetical protein
MSRYKSDEVKHAEDKCKLANRVFMLERELTDVKADRDQWKQEHENLLSVREQDIRALSDKIERLQSLLKRARNHIQDWWNNFGDGGSELPPYKSPELIDDIERELQ